MAITELNRGARFTLKNLKERTATAEKLLLAGEYDAAAIEYTAVRAAAYEMLHVTNRLKQGKTLDDAEQQEQTA